MEDVSISLEREMGVLSSLAAASDTSEADGHRPMLERLSLVAMPLLHEGALKSPPDTGTEKSGSRPALRPRGNFTARRLGTAVHLFLEEAANRLATGLEPSQLAAEIPTWGSRIRAVLCGDGFAPRHIERAVQIVLKAIHTSLLEPVGRWLLGARLAAHSELALEAKGSQMIHCRIDRVFRAGAMPGETGSEYLWIIDYKTTAFVGDSKDPISLRSFFANERERFAPQLEAYANIFQSTRIRLGIWYPLMGQLTWWTAESAHSSKKERKMSDQLSLYGDAMT